MKNKADKTMLKVGVIGTILIAICCVTPVLVILLGVAGLGAITGYLDYVLLPALLLFVVVAIYGYFQMRQRNGDCCAKTNISDKK